MYEFYQNLSTELTDLLKKVHFTVWSKPSEC